MDLVVQ